MSAFDALAIADALAARYASGTLTPPSGYGAIRKSTARLPNNIPTSPWVLVILQNGEVLTVPQQVTLEYHVQFHYAKASGDTARDMTGMQAWIAPLLEATFAQGDLGLNASQHVKSAFPSTFLFDVFTYGGQEFYGWDITVEVILRDLGWTFT